MLTLRLKTLTDLVLPGKCVIDVGTDHGYVPVALAKSGYPGAIIASDINPEPLASAKRLADAENVSDKIKFFISDGLSAFSGADTVIIAGMGGDLICRIIDNCGWLRCPDVRLILQPMTKPEILRYFLTRNGFGITEEKLVKENRHIFQIMCAKYNGVLLTAGMKDVTGASVSDPYSDAELFVGRRRLLFCTEEYRELTFNMIERINKKIIGTEVAGLNEKTIAEYQFYSSVSSQLKRLYRSL